MLRTPARAAVTVAVIAAAALLLSGCSGDSGGGSGGAPESPVRPDTILSANSTKQLGTTVVDGSSNTLHRFDAHSADPPTATCVDACADDWPPALTADSAPGATDGNGVDDAWFAIKPDGSTAAPPPGAT
jgi:predicted lipoprotein with Yx(FWY)xxD motif